MHNIGEVSRNSISKSYAYVKFVYTIKEHKGLLTWSAMALE